MSGAGPQIVQTIATTPMRDVVRGRMSGRLDIDGAIEEADLPDALADLTRRVVKRTRLSRLEKADVAREIASHFREGLDAGREPEELIKAFGDADDAARLIRRGKKRSRGPIYKVWVRGWQVIGVLVVVLLVAYTIQAIRFHTGSPTIAHDYLADLNEEATSVPPEERAWPVYEKAILAMTDAPKHVDIDDADPGEGDWDVVVRYVEENAQAIALLRKAARYDEMGFVVGEPFSDELMKKYGLSDTTPSAGWDGALEGSLIGVLLPQIGSIRQGANLLAADTRLGRLQRDSERVVSNVKTIVRMGEHMWSSPPFLINQLVGISLVSMAAELVNEVLYSDPEFITQEQLQELAHCLAGFRGGGRIALSFEAERFTFYDILQRMYTDDGSGDGMLASSTLRIIDVLDNEAPPAVSGLESVTGPVIASVVASRADMRNEYDRILDEYQSLALESPWDRDWSVDSRIDDLLSRPTYKLRYPLISFLMPALSHTIRSSDSVTMQRDSALAVIAICLFRREHGRLPESLADLEPEYLPALPKDMIDGNPIRYLPRDSSFVLYSIGADEDDDGGVPALRRDGTRDPAVRTNAQIDGDWILFPPEER